VFGRNYILKPRTQVLVILLCFYNIVHGCMKLLFNNIYSIEYILLYFTLTITFSNVIFLTK